jgi:NADPH2 dehydrogenase
MLDVSPLFQPLHVRTKTLPNRIVMPPMVVLRGITSAAGIAWYGEHARGGVGLVIIEATAVNRFGDELTADTLSPLVSAIHDAGALAAIQLFPVTFGTPVSPHELSTEQVDELVAQYARATEICGQAGMDAVEPHGAHGYLLNQFFSPEQNQRTDAYGGELANRMRLAMRIATTLRPVCDMAEMLLLYRHTPVGKGYGMDQSLALASDLVHAGVDVLDISPAGEIPGELSAPFMGLGVPVIAVTELNEVDRALEVITQGRGDLVAIGRGLIADPQWPLKVREGRGDEITECLRCDQGCFGNLRRGEPVECVLRA